MLLRSASSPLLNCVRTLTSAAVEHQAVVSPSLAPVPAPRYHGAVLCRAMSEGDLAAQLLAIPATRAKKDHEGGVSGRDAGACGAAVCQGQLARERVLLQPRRRRAGRHCPPQPDACVAASSFCRASSTGPPPPPAGPCVARMVPLLSCPLSLFRCLSRSLRPGRLG
jgi:hypothetical protein